MIISILGMSGEFNGKETSAYYDCKVLNQESKAYRNSTDVLLQNYDDLFYLLGTQEAIAFQKRVLDLSEKRVEFIEVDIDDLDEVFERVFELISTAKKEKVLLDITHGFRDQSISAIFSATLHHFLNQSHIEVLFAKQVEVHKQYAYMLLNDYINLTQLSLLLTGFIRTLNFVNSIEVEGLNTLAFENFSKALLSNDFRALEISYKNLESTLHQAKKNKEFKHLQNLFSQIEEILYEFKDFSHKKMYEKYMILAKLMFKHNYYLLSLTYLFEAIRLYASDAFYSNQLITENAWTHIDMYKINSEVIACIGQKEFGYRYRSTRYDRDDFYEKNREKFEKVATEYRKLRLLRNNLTHINHKISQPNIKGELEVLLKNVNILIEEDILKVLSR